MLQHTTDTHRYLLCCCCCCLSLSSLLLPQIAHFALLAFTRLLEFVGIDSEHNNIFFTICCFCCLRLALAYITLIFYFFAAIFMPKVLQRSFECGTLLVAAHRSPWVRHIASLLPHKTQMRSRVMLFKQAIKHNCM
jgi:hypothetical protein